MDFPRLAIAIILCFLVFVLWEMFFIDREVVQPPSESRQTGQMAKEEPFNKDFEKGFVDKKVMSEVISDKDDLLKPIKEARTITVNTPLYSVKISEKGAVFNDFILKDYKENGGDDSPLYQMISPEIHDKGTVLLGFAGNSLPGLKQAVFNVNRDSESVNIDDQSEEIVFSWVSENGVVVEKKFIFSPETYLIGLNVIIKNASHQAIQDNLILSLMKTYSKTKTMYGFEGPSALINDSLQQIKAKKIKDKNIYTGALQWVTVQDRYFMSSIIATRPVEASMRLFLSQDGMLEAQYMQPETVIQPGMQHGYEYKLFFGPKSTKILKQCDYNLSKAIDFGMFDFIAKPCLWFMNFLYGVIPNYGVAIIILTIVTKIILWPLGTKSYKSMAEMKKIQPLMVGIREKYKNDKKRMNEEIMALYKTYKVNPVGGCLPMIVQLPVFFALYRMLYEAIELRHAHFLGWITDLSAPDRLFHFNFSIPLMQPPYGIPVLTIIMGATMFLQQRMSPSVGDPTQAKMMKFMPVIFTVIFINFSSGLVLYWLINNVLSIAQQHYITKK
ncbi:MAG: membrane protein insertase YidC [Desulfobacterales bacterium]|uniref:Membrane protein insertase YidC n=1 Tax=Candidatus Desulfaltia bathyphila TaxID=2841697 RepID=A0A8J6T6D6_9BACT|nr:membrane protein insertase YidC [Candidatus Desulfaltia bathyphila]MBL7194836.1 membrane protein insertase YidC [Desulfobacterales bacterium]MBL7206932.1 membrane protein insertase YidC [Desulfobacterales bacterium]